MAEGALNEEEAKLKRKEWTAKRAEAGYTTATSRIAAAVQKKTGMETRVCIPGHMQRGGSPSAYDRVLATQFGSYAAKLVEIERYGVTVALVNGHVTANRLEDIAGKTRNVPEGCELLTVARRMGVSLAEVFLNQPKKGALPCIMQRGAPFGFAIPRAYKRLLILVHFLVVLLVVAAGDVLHPLLVVEVPVDGQDNALLERGLRVPARSFLILVGSMP